MNRAGLPKVDFRWLCGHGLRFESWVEINFGYSVREVADGFEKAAGVEPVHPFQRGTSEGFEASPGSAAVDDERVIFRYSNRQPPTSRLKKSPEPIRFIALVPVVM